MKRTLTDQEIDYLISGHRYDFAAVLYSCWRSGLISADQLVQYVGLAWVTAGAPYMSPHQILSDSEWLELFRAAGFTYNGAPAKPEAQRLYRTSSAQLAGNWAWTPNREFAEYLRTELSYPDLEVWAIDAPAEHMLCHYEHDVYNEIVCDTTGLTIYRADEIEALTCDTYGEYQHKWLDGWHSHWKANRYQKATL